jgi:predicted enzyme related to lactoylglutathione lyase
MKLSINIDVDDLQKGVAFYQQAVGLSPVRRFGDSVVELEGGDVPVFLLQKGVAKPPFTGAASARDYGRHWTPVHLDFIVEDIEKALAKALAAGARAESPIGPYGWGQIVLMSDPFGNGFCLLTVDETDMQAQAKPYATDPSRPPR